MTYQGISREGKRGKWYVQTRDSEYQAKTIEKGYRLKAGDKVYIDKELLDTRVAQRKKNSAKRTVKKHVEKRNEDKMFKNMMIYENSDFFAINKPNGLPSQGGDGIKNHVEQIATNHLQKQRFGSKSFLLHRLDQYTSGAMVVGKNIHYSRTFSGMMKEKKIPKTYKALTQGIPRFIYSDALKVDITTPENFLSGLIRSDQDCIVHDHTMLNPSVCFLSDQMKFLTSECEKLSMFSETPKHEIVDEIAKKRCEMTTVYQILAFSFWDKHAREFKNFQLKDQNGEVTKYSMYNLLDLLKEYSECLNEGTECYTYFKITPETGKKHQIRKHLSKVLHTPVLGDGLYGYEAMLGRNLFQNTLNYDKDQERRMLHQSVFLHSDTIMVPLEHGKRREVEAKKTSRRKLEMKEIRAELPEKFRNVLDALQINDE